jgi:AmpD protein
LRTPALGDDGWVRGLRRVASPNFGPRPAGTAIDLAVVHSISLPPGVYGGDAVERLFTNTLDCDAHPYYDRLRGLRVSAHFVITRDGAATQYVSVHERAWHAGASSWRGRPDCNDYAVGIELEGLEGDAFEDAQYTTLAALLRALNRHHRLAGVVGHEHVAPGRKHDPGPGFDWPRLRRRLRWPRGQFA